MLRHYRPRLIQLHLSEAGRGRTSWPLSMATVWSIQEIARLIPSCPVILESIVKPEAIDSEFAMAAKCFEVPQPVTTSAAG